MKQSRLDELMLKAKENKIEISELAEICGALLESTSRHSKDIKAKISAIEDKLTYIEETLDQIIENQNPAFGVIVEDDEEED